MPIGRSIAFTIVATRSSAWARVSRAMPGSDARIDNPILQSWRFRDGKVIRLEMLGAGPEFQKALEAAGLSD